MLRLSSGVCVFPGAPPHVPDTWLFGRAALWIPVCLQQQQQPLESAGSPAVFPSRSGWQGHTGAQTFETTRYAHKYSFFRLLLGVFFFLRMVRSL